MADLLAFVQVLDAERQSILKAAELDLIQPLPIPVTPDDCGSLCPTRVGGIISASDTFNRFTALVKGIDIVGPVDYYLVQDLEAVCPAWQSLLEVAWRSHSRLIETASTTNRPRDFPVVEQAAADAAEALDCLRRRLPMVGTAAETVADPGQTKCKPRGRTTNKIVQKRNKKIIALVKKGLENNDIHEQIKKDFPETKTSIHTIRQVRHKAETEAETETNMKSKPSL